MEEKLRIFIDSIFHYFEHTYQEKVDIGSPYLVDSLDVIDAEYTGLITVTGEYRGVCCFSTPKELLEKIITAVGVDDVSENMLFDTAGEIANTLSGNVRKHLGAEFNISVPIVFEGKPDASYFSPEAKIYAIPIKWRGNKATLGVSLVQ